MRGNTIIVHKRAKNCLILIVFPPIMIAMKEVSIMIRVTVWNEFVHEKNNPEAITIYPDGIHETIRRFLSEEEDFVITVATFDMEEHGLTQEVLDQTDVLLWRGHMRHKLVSDAVVARVRERILCGMGLIALHSAHFSKIFTTMMGTGCTLGWRMESKERLWCVDPSHPIARDVPQHFCLDNEEIYCEPFDIPNPDESVFIGWYQTGEVFRSGQVYRRGYGKIFYFQPGHETVPTYHNPHIQKIIKNAVRYLYNPVKREGGVVCTHNKSPEESE